MADLWFFVRLYRTQRGWMLLGAVFAMIAGFAAVSLLTVSGWFITAAALAGLAVPTGAIGFNLLYPAAAIRGLAVGRTVSRYVERVLTHEATLRNLASLRVWFFDRATPLAPGRLAAMRSGDLLTRATADIDTLDSLFPRVLVPSMVALAVAVAAAALFGALLPAAAFGAIGLLALAGLGVPALAARLGRGPGRRITEATALLQTRLVDLAYGLPDLLANGAEQRAAQAIDDASEAVIEAQRGMARLAGLAAALILLLAQGAMLLTLVVGAAAVNADALTGPQLAMLVLMTLALFEVVAPLPLAYQALGRVRTAAARVREIATLAPTIAEPPAGEGAEPDGHRLHLDHVSFRYPGTERTVLDRIDLRLEPGARLALVGPSGCGKSTIVALALRFFDPDQGAVRIDGVDVRGMRAAAVFRRFAVMTQRTDLLDATVRDNLLLADTGADDTALWRALETAGLADFVRGLPEGLDTWVGENGTKLSGGQGKRLALARMVLKNAPIWLLDEPTVGLDADTEADVLARVAEASRGKSLILVTHGRAGIALVDRVVSMEAGRIIADTDRDGYLAAQ